MGWFGVGWAGVLWGFWGGVGGALCLHSEQYNNHVVLPQYILEIDIIQFKLEEKKRRKYKPLKCTENQIENERNQAKGWKFL